MKFVDEAVILVEGGRGGDGCISFRREKFVPRGGPDGGDGGDGGSVWITGDQSLESLADLEYRRVYKAGKGGHGRGKRQHGRKGDSLYIPVPLGTDVYEGDRLLGEILKPGQRLLVAKGGKGGRGNARFATSINVAPKVCEKGKPGEKRELRLVLRILAEVGIVGFPNAGKSTLLKRITSARPKIAPYPFTTLTPNLGVVKDGFYRYTIADLPGIIEGAHKGRGLGDRFLRHIERTKVLVFLLDNSRDDPLKDYEELKQEIRLYNPEILKKPRIVVFNKIDLLPTTHPLKEDSVLYISALKSIGIEEFLDKLKTKISNGT